MRRVEDSHAQRREREYQQQSDQQNQIESGNDEVPVVDVDIQGWRQPGYAEQRQQREEPADAQQNPSNHAVDYSARGTGI